MKGEAPPAVPSEHITAWARCHHLDPSYVRRHWNQFQDTMWTYTPLSRVEQVVVYGTLRPGDYNDGRTGLSREAAKNNPRDGDAPFRRVHIPGARIYNLGDRRQPAYPHLVLTGDETDVVVGDMCTIDWSSSTGSGILSMEFGARYVLSYVPVLEHREDDVVEYKEVAVFVYSQEISRHQYHIPSGDWFEFAKVRAR